MQIRLAWVEMSRYRPLMLDNKYVERGDPADRHLKGDLRFMAEKMGVKDPPIHGFACVIHFG